MQLGLLCLMVMLCALKESESEHSGSADAVGRNHTLYRKLHRLSGAGSHQDAVGSFLEVTDITGMTVPFLLFELLACEDSVLTVDDDDVITAVNVGCKGYLVLASEQDSGLSRYLTEGLAGSVDDIPLALDLAFFCHISGHNSVPPDRIFTGKGTLISNKTRNKPAFLLEISFTLYSMLTYLTKSEIKSQAFFADF